MDIRDEAMQLRNEKHQMVVLLAGRIKRLEYVIH